MPMINVQQVAVLIIAVIAIILVFKFMKGCIKSVVCLFILVAGAILFFKVGGLDGISEKVNDYIETESIYFGTTK